MEKLSWGERLGYGVGDLGINFYFQTALTYLLFFYTDVFGISAALAGTVFLVARIVDAVTDPLMGTIADRTKSRFGKLRPYLLWGPLPMAAVAVLTFTAPELGEGGRRVWAFATYIAFGITYTVVSIPYSALTAALTSDSQARTDLSTIRMAFAMGGGLLVSVFTLPLVESFGGGAVGFQRTMLLYGACATLLLWTTFATTRERLAPSTAEPVAVTDLLRVFRGNRPLWIIMTVFVLGMLAFTLRQAAVVYFLKYNLGREDLVPLFFGAAMPAGLLGIALVPWISRRFGKAGGIVLGGIVTFLGGLGVYLTPDEWIWTVLFFYLVATFGAVPLSVLGWAMLPDTVEYGEWKSGVRADGTIYAVASFGQKLSMAVGGAAAGAVLSVTGYVANAEQGAAALAGIEALVTLVPMLMVVLMVVTVRFYTLDEETHGRIVAELAARRS